MSRPFRTVAVALLLWVAPVGPARSQEEPMTLSLSSTAFPAAGEIPKEYTCDGEDVSPPLAWSGAPAGTKSFVLIVDDPDGHAD